LVCCAEKNLATLLTRRRGTRGGGTKKRSWKFWTGNRFKNDFWSGPPTNALSSAAATNLCYFRTALQFCKSPLRFRQPRRNFLILANHKTHISWLLPSTYVDHQRILSSCQEPILRSRAGSGL
jgi:hypothetical protein